MKTYYGNYLGMVISGGDKDPDKRGRCQVFIPHIMPTLYEGWNKEGKDRTIQIVGSNLENSLTLDEINNLKTLLPWAECSAPITGSGPSFHYTQDGKANQAALNVGLDAAMGVTPLQKAGQRSGAGEDIPATIAPNGDKTAVINANSSVWTDGTLNPQLVKYKNEILGGSTGTPTGKIRYASLLAANAVFNQATKDGIDMKVATGGGSNSHSWNHGDISTGIGESIDIKPVNGWSSQTQTEQYATIAIGTGANRIGFPYDYHGLHVQTSFSKDVGGSGAPSTSWAYGGSKNAKIQALVTQNSIYSGKLTDNPSGDVAQDGHAGMNTQSDTAKEQAQYENKDNGLAQLSINDVKKNLGLTKDSEAQTATTAYKTAYNLSIGKGATPAQANIAASAIIGSIAQESGFNINTVHDGGRGYGLLGEQGSILNNMKTFAANKKPPETIQTGGISAQTQIEALFNEPLFLNGRPSSGGPAWQGLQTLFNAPNVEEAARLFSGQTLNSTTGWGYLRPGTPNFERRIGNAVAASNTFSNQTIADAANQPTIQNPLQGKDTATGLPVPRGASYGPDTNNQATGMFGYAREGQLVWCFFQEGNPLFPVYFGASYGQQEWNNISQKTSPGMMEPGFDATVMNLQGGGFRSARTVAGENQQGLGDDFVFELYHKMGHNLMFGIDNVQLNSKYNFKQQTEGDHHSVTLGNRETRTLGDANQVVGQTQYITIGNWEQDALDAAGDLQAIINDAMNIGSS